MSPLRGFVTNFISCRCYLAQGANTSRAGWKFMKSNNFFVLFSRLKNKTIYKNVCCVLFRQKTPRCFTHNLKPWQAFKVGCSPNHTSRASEFTHRGPSLELWLAVLWWHREGEEAVCYLCDAGVDCEMLQIVKVEIIYHEKVLSTWFNGDVNILYMVFLSASL